MGEVESRIYMKYEKLYGALPIRLVDDPTDRMLHEGDVIKFVGNWHYLTGFYKVTNSVEFERRKATYNYNGTLYPLILGPGQYIQLDMSDLIPIDENVLQQYRVGIPDGILVYVSYPMGNTRFSMNNPVYRVLPSVDDDRAYIGSYTSADSPFDAPRLEITNVYTKEENVYLTVKNDTPTYKKVLLNLIMNKLKVVKCGETEEYIPFYHSEVIP